MKNLEFSFTEKEKEFLNVFLPEQDIYDQGCGAMDLEEIILNGCKLSMNQIKGIISALQTKEIVSIDECNGKTFVYVGYIFTQDEQGEQLFKTINEQIKN